MTAPIQDYIRAAQQAIQPPEEPSPFDRIFDFVDTANDLATGFFTGVGGSLLATAKGISRFPGIRSFTERLDERLPGVFPDRIIERGQEFLQEATPETFAGAAGSVIGRVGGDIGQIIATGGAARAAQLPNIGAKLGLGPVGRGALRSTPLFTTQAAGGEEASMAGALAELTASDDPEQSETRRRFNVAFQEIAEDPKQRIGFEAATDIVLGGAVEKVIDFARTARAASASSRGITEGFEAPRPVASATPDAPNIRTLDPRLEETRLAARQQSQEQIGRMFPEERGAISREAVTSLATGAVGAGIGTAVDPNKPRGAVLGLGLGLAGPSVARSANLDAFLKRNFTSAGDLPKDVHRRMIGRDGSINSELRDITFTLRDYDKAIKQSPRVERQAIDRVLKGQADPSTIPERLRPVVQRMRNQIDVLSRRLIDSGAIEGDLVATVTDNLGVYATRSYRIFDDPKWALSVSTDVRNKAKAFLRSELSDQGLVGRDLEDRAQLLMERLLYRPKDGPMALLTKGSKLGSKDLSILKRRGDIAPEIRALWGESDDAVVNYARSVTKMTNLLENHRFLTDVREAGLGRFLFEPNDTRALAAGAHEEFASAGSRVLEPLNGLFATPEVARAFRDALEPRNQYPWLLRQYFKANAATKFAKTVLSPMTHVRNTIGNIGFAVANGHWRILHAGTALKTISANVGTTNSKQWREYYRKLQRLGVVHESARANELQDVLRDATVRNTGKDPSIPVKIGRKGLQLAVGAYRAEDDVWKVFAFENEAVRYGKALPHLSIDEIETMAAEIVRNTYPTYSLVPRGVKALRKIPFGPFVSFPAEVVRTLGNSMTLMARELSTPALRPIGLQRMAGLAAAAGGVSAATAASRFLVGKAKDEDEDIRRFLPEWSENSNLIYLGQSENGNVRIVDVSYTDPYSYIRTPLIAFMRGGDWRAKIFDALFEALDPFISEEMLSASALDALRNNKRSGGGRVFNPQDSWDRIAQDIATHLGKAFEPGVATQARRVLRGLTGKQTTYGRSYDPKLEAMAVATGFRIQEVDVRQGMSFKVSRFRRETSDANQILRAVASRRGAVSDAELTSAYLRAERSREKLFDATQLDIEAAERLGVTARELQGILLAGGLTRQQEFDLSRGGYRPYNPTGQFLGSVAGDQGELLRRRQFLQNLARQR